MVTYPWLVNLASTAVTMIICTMILGRSKHLSNIKALFYALPILLFVGTLSLEYLPAFYPDNLTISALAAFTGIMEGMLWLLWSEHFSRIRAKFSVIHIGMLFGILLFISMLVEYILPTIILPVFVSSLVLASCGLLISRNANAPDDFPRLLPKSSSLKAKQSIIIGCLITFATSTACYYLTAIVPWEILPLQQGCFMLGILVGSIALVVLSGFCFLLRNHIDIFKIFPHLLGFTILGLSFYIADQGLYAPAFLIALSISTILEISIIMYFGKLIHQGFVTPALAFTFPVASIRLGIFTGNSLALLCEHFPDSLMPWTPEISLFFVCLLAFLLIPMCRREAIILSLTNAPVSPPETDVICQQITDEFNLSKREDEILRLLAHNYTTSTISTKLVISPHTVNTHIRHIYEKTNIHKRGELLEYINMRRDDG